MEISGYPHYENVCSNILEFFLNPYNEHGLTDLVLNSIIQLIDKDFTFKLESEEIEIKREFKTICNNRLDLLVLTENYSIGIENKIFHYLHNDLTDYKNTVNSYCFDQRKPICIVLSLDKLNSFQDLKKINDNSFVNITYADIFNNIKQNFGKYISSSNLIFVNYLTDFIKSIENLTSSTMENKALWSFFKNNSQSIQELTESFAEYRNYLNQKVIQLKDTLPKEEFAPSADSQWIYKNTCLVHDYIFNDEYRIAIDAYIYPHGWEISVFGRDNKSNNFFFNTMCKKDMFLPQPIENYENSERLIFQRFDSEIDISVVSESLSNLLRSIEKYRK